jgi:hypothetical protein
VRPEKEKQAMRRPERAVRDSALISATAIIMAAIALLSIKTMVSISSAHEFDPFLPSVFLGVVACFTLFARRFRQSQLALGVFLLLIGGATLVLPRLLVNDFFQNDFDWLPVLLGPWSLFVGGVLFVVSLLDYRHWMNSWRTTLLQTLLLAGPGAFLLIICFLVIGPSAWRASPYGLDLIVASWLVGMGIFLAGSRFVPRVSLNTHHETIFRED